MKKQWLFLAVLLLPLKVFPQNNSAPVFEYHRFYLKEPARELLELKYDNSCEPADGKLMPDGKSVLIRNYQPHQRMYVRLINAEGRITEIIQSPCYIDPVIGEL